MEYKAFKFEMKELKEDGTFEGYAAVFNNVDSGNDLIEEGAFKKTLKENKEFALFYMHTPLEILGISKPKVDDYGLWFTGYFNKAVQRAVEIYELTKQKAIKAISIGYDALEFGYKEIKGKRIRILKEIRLYEISLLPAGFGMNPKALVTDIKMINQLYKVINDDKLREALFKEPSKEEKTDTLIKKPLELDLSEFYIKLIEFNKFLEGGK